METKVNAFEKLIKGELLKNSAELSFGKINVKMEEIVNIQGNSALRLLHTFSSAFTSHSAFEETKTDDLSSVLWVRVVFVER